MRISTQQIQQVGISSILRQQEKLNHTQQQLATGKRVLLPSDDPVGTSQLLQLRQSIETTKQYQANAQAAVNRLQQEEGVLINVTELLQRVRELAVQGNNASQTNETRSFMAMEIRQQLDALLGLANTRDGTGDYLFGGTKGSTQPFVKNAQGQYVYEGDQNQRFLQVGSDRKIADGDPGSAVFQLVRNGNGVFTTSVAGGITAAADEGNIGDGRIAKAMVGAQYLPQLAGYSIEFDGTDSYSVTDPDGNVVATGTYTGTMPGDISIPLELDTDGDGTTDITTNVAVTVTGTPYGTDHFTLRFESRPQGTAAIGEISLNGSFVPSLPGGYTLTFSRPDPDGPINYEVRDTNGVTVTTGVHAANTPIEFRGARIMISGTPAEGDTFSVRSSEYQSVFQTLEDLANALATPVNDAAGQARLNDAVNRAIGNIDLAMDNILTVRASVGARLKAIDSQTYVNDGYLVQAQETLSSVEDLDYAEAISRLHMQLTGLEAAQQTYLKVNGLSMFNYLR